MTLRELEDMIAQLSLTEKTELLQWIVRDMSKTVEGIESTPGVVGGNARIAGTRIPVWSIVRSRQLGMSDAEILTNYPSLHAEDLVNAWAYARANHEEIERQILENESDEVLTENE